MGDDQSARSGPQRHRVGADRDVALGQQAPDLRGDAGPERLERAVLRRDEDQPDVVEPAGTHVLAGHQGQLVEREGPGDRAWHGEGHALDAPCVEVFEQRGEGADVARAGEGQRPRDRHVGRRPDRDEQRVIVQRVAAHRANAARLGVDRREPVGPQVCAVVSRDADEIEASRGGAPEGLSHRALALDELGVGLEQLDLGPWTRGGRGGRSVLRGRRSRRRR